jgi:hypothetical protein
LIGSNSIDKTVVNFNHLVGNSASGKVMSQNRIIKEGEVKDNTKKTLNSEASSSID